jgi:hypothetical protein
MNRCSKWSFLFLSFRYVPKAWSGPFLDLPFESLPSINPPFQFPTHRTAAAYQPTPPVPPPAKRKQNNFTPLHASLKHRPNPEHFTSRDPIRAEAQEPTSVSALRSRPRSPSPGSRNPAILPAIKGIDWLARVPGTVDPWSAEVEWSGVGTLGMAVKVKVESNLSIVTVTVAWHVSVSQDAFAGTNQRCFSTMKKMSDACSGNLLISWDDLGKMEWRGWAMR